MASKGRQIVVEFLGNDKSLSTTAKKVEGTTGRLGGRLGKVGLIAGGVVVAGLGAAAVAAVKMGKAAAEDEVSQKRLSTALHNTAGASNAQVAGVEKWISAQGTALGVTDDELRPALGRLVAATGDVGKAQKLASLGMDISAGSGKSLEAVSLALAKAQNGSVGGLAKLGVATKDAAGKALTFDQIQKNLAKTFGGQASAKAATFQGKMDRLKLVFDETQEAIGARLIPIATKLAGWFLDKGLPAISKFGDYLSKNLGPVFAKVGGFFKKFGEDGGKGSGKFGAAIARIKPIVSSMTSVVKSAIGIVTSLWKRFGGTITSFATTAFKSVIGIVGGGWKIIAGIFKVFSSLLKGDWKGVWDGIKSILSGAWSLIKGVISLGWAAIKGIFTLGGQAIKAIFVGLWNALKAAASAGWNAIKSAVSAGWSAIKSAFSSAGSAIKSVFSGIWSSIKATATAGITSLVAAFKSIPGRLKALGGLLANAGKGLLTSLLNGISGAAGFVGNFATRIWTAIKSAINSGIDSLNRKLKFSVTIAGKTFSLGAPTIQHLYKGGIIPASKDGIPFIGGDRNHAEAVIPLDGPHAPDFGGGDVHITLTLDSEVVHRALVKRKRNLGRELGLA